jgi:hypothetical protein
VSAVANQAKEFAVEQDVAVILLHQLNAQVKEWEPPTAASLKYGGFPESDFVVGLWRPGTDPELRAYEASLRRREVKLKVLKDRIFGTEGQVSSYTLAPSMRLNPAD